MIGASRFRGRGWSYKSDGGNTLNFANENQISTIENAIAAPLFPFVVRLFGLVASKPISVKKGARCLVHLAEPKTTETNAVMFDGGLITDFAFVATLQAEGFELAGCHKSKADLRGWAGVSEATGMD